MSNKTNLVPDGYEEVRTVYHREGKCMDCLYPAGYGTRVYEKPGSDEVIATDIFSGCACQEAYERNPTTYKK